MSNTGKLDQISLHFCDNEQATFHVAMQVSARIVRA
jgi:hypothetical protein